MGRTHLQKMCWKSIFWAHWTLHSSERFLPNMGCLWWILLNLLQGLPAIEWKMLIIRNKYPATHRSWLQTLGLVVTSLPSMLWKMGFQRCWSVPSCLWWLCILWSNWGVLGMLQGLWSRRRPMCFFRKQHSRSKWPRLQNLGLGRPNLSRMLWAMDF